MGTTLAIESSCDDSCVALVSMIDHQLKIDAEMNVTHKSLHRAFGGVFPHLMSTWHEASFLNSFRQLPIANHNIECVSVTIGPGIYSCLSRGVFAARIISTSERIPMIGVHHMEGHLYSADNIPFDEFPFMCVLLSGGHTLIILCEGRQVYTIISQSLDDNIGELYDKIARELPISLKGPLYNGAMVEDIMGNTPLHESSHVATRNTANLVDFSFSGLKTEYCERLRNSPQTDTHIIKETLSMLQREIEHQLYLRMTKALDILQSMESKPRFITIGGGVISNRSIQRCISSIADQRRIPIFMPRKEYATDNAMMIGKMGLLLYKWNRIQTPQYPIQEYPLGFLKDDDAALEAYN